jgi:hypothetical protein
LNRLSYRLGSGSALQRALAARQLEHGQKRLLDFFDSGMVQLFDSEWFRGTHDHHESKLALAVENIDPPATSHSTKLRLAEPLADFARTKAGGPQFTGIERYRKTMLNAFHRIAFRKKIHATMEGSRCLDEGV